MRECLVCALLAIVCLAGNAIMAAPGDVQQTFTNPTEPPSGIDYFGSSIAAVGSSVLVGAWGDNNAGADYTGAAHLFDRASGGLIRTLLNPTPEAYDHFGKAVAALGSNVLVGAPGDNGGGTSAGAAYLFDSGSGALLQTFQKLVPEDYDYFGTAIAAMGNKVLIGAPEDNSAGPNAGAAYLFDTSGNIVQTFLNPSPEFYDYFGGALAMVGNNVLIGAQGDNTGGQQSGAAYLFDGSNGALLRTFLNPDPDEYDNFGYSLAAVGQDKVLIGAPYDDTGAADAGAAYLFNANTGALLTTLQKPTPAAYDYFGTSVAGDLEAGVAGGVRCHAKAVVITRRAQLACPGQVIGVLGLCGRDQRKCHGQQNRQQSQLAVWKEVKFPLHNYSPLWM